MAKFQSSMSARLQSFLVGAMVVVVATTASAQERKPFFERDFAKNPLEEGATARPERDRSAAQPDTASETTPEVSASDAVTRAKERIDALSEGKESKGQTELTALATTHKVLSVGAVLNSLDKPHFEEKMKELLEVVDRYDFDVGFIWAIGSVQNLVNSPEAIYLVARRAMIEAAEAPPEHYKISMSPTWVIRTAAGEILLEATGPLAANFNAKGEFVERPNEMRVERKEDPAPVGEGEQEAPTPTATVAPTATPDPLFGGVQPKL